MAIITSRSDDKNSIEREVLKSDVFISSLNDSEVIGLLEIHETEALEFVEKVLHDSDYCWALGIRGKNYVNPTFYDRMRVARYFLSLKYPTIN
ncbi:hypothetical protein HYX18_00030 [Candidatus Woesearchaeota archaeon]|nr:hypothetical protein [Candidatus Woesearchaeota archaeon]